MNIDNVIRAFSGVAAILGLVLAYSGGPEWLLLTAVAGVFMIFPWLPPS